jgi:C4-dicarboxylate-specific signal transduction histidine kinase
MFRESIHPDDRPFVEKAANEARNQKTDFEVDHRIVLADGSVRHVHSVSHPVLNDSGDLVEFIGTIMDVTERKQAEEALRLAQGELAHMNRATTLGELSTSLAHEVNQPIAAAVTDASTCLRNLIWERPASLRREPLKTQSVLGKSSGGSAGCLRRVLRNVNCLT